MSQITPDDESITKGPVVAREDIALFDTSKSGVTNLRRGGLRSGGTPITGPTNYLLYGYNVIKNGYVDSQNVNKRYAILDGTKLQDTDFAKVDSTRSTSTYIVSDHVSSLLDKFNASADVKYKGAVFGGGIKAEYGLSKELGGNEKLIKYMGFYRVYEQYLVADNTRIRELLSPQFKRDLANPAIQSDKKLSFGGTGSEDFIDTLFDNYGTHLIQRYYLGGRFDLNFNYTSSSVVTNEALKASVEAAYAGFSASGTAQTQKDAKTVTEHSSMTFRSVGGSLITGTTAEEVSKQFREWLDSLKTANDICEIGNFNAAMLPIWELTDDPGIKDRLKHRFNALLEEADGDLKALDPRPQYITDIVVSADKNAASARKKLPGDYVKVCLNPGTNDLEIYDANRSVGGDFIFIGYKLGHDRSQATYDIQVGAWRKGGDAPHFYSDGGHVYRKIGVDLNKGAGGDFIYLYYSKANDDDKQFIKEIRGTYGECSLPSGWTWTKGKTDLNKGAGGGFIYLAFRAS